MNAENKLPQTEGYNGAEEAFDWTIGDTFREAPEPSLRNGSNNDIDTFNWADEDRFLPVSTPATKPFDSEQFHSHARRGLATGLVLLLALTICAILIMLAGHLIQVTDLKEFSVLLGPLVALVSAATGFYFGTKGN